ncbi:MAG: ACT domain-containing protein [Alphaproteobacteria bacterium]
MTHTLSIHLTPTEGFLQRIIGLIERRGFSVGAINMPMVAADRAEMTISVIARDGTRSTDILSRQIMRLIDVKQVTPIQENGGPR